MASPKTFSQYSQEAQDYAYRQANRKAQGKNITQYGQSKEFRDAYSSLIRENPEVARAIQQGNEARVAANESGFATVQEYAALQKFAKPTPQTGNVPIPVGSVAGGTLLSDGTILRVSPFKAIKMSPAQIAAQLRSGNILQPLSPGGRSVVPSAPMSYPNPFIQALQSGQRQSTFKRNKVTFNYPKLGGVADFVSGGFFTERELNKRQRSINTAMDSFNARYGNRELSDADYYKAQQIYNQLSQAQAQVDFERQALKTSVKKQINRLFTGNAVEINWRTGEPIRDPKTGKPVKSIINIVPFPLEPVGLPPSKVLGIKFIGKQTVNSEGSIITNVAFKTSSGRVGIARGVTVQQDERALTFTFGRSAAKSIGLPTGKIRLRKLNTFAGIEGTKVTPNTITIKEGMEVVIKGKKVQVGYVARQLEATKQVGRGRVMSVPGRAFAQNQIEFPTARIIRVRNKNIRLDDFKSLSAVLTKDDLSVIVGKSITARGDKAKFIGLIKSEKSADEIIRLIGHPKTQQQYKQALKNVISAVASAEARANAKALGTLNTLTRAARATAVGIAAKEIVRGASTGLTTLPGRVSAVQVKRAQAVLTQVPQVVFRQAPRTIVAISQALAALTDTKTAQQARQVLRQFNVTQQKIKTLLRQVPRLQFTTKQVEALQRLRIRVPSVPIPFSIPFGTKLEDVTNLPMRKVRNGGYVVALRKRGRFTIVSGIMSGSDARDYGAYLVDNSISRTVKLVPKRGRILALPGRYKGYFNRIKAKLRGYAIRKGKKISLDRIYIEKRRYALDKQNERREIRR